MTFKLDKAREILSRTPLILETMLSGLSEEWLMHNEGENTWSPYDVIGHLIHGEKTDWVIRTKIILSNSEHKTFQPFDRFAQKKDNVGKSISELLKTFKQLRAENLTALNELQIKTSDFIKEGTHPELGTVNLKQLLSSWVVHDLGHIAQISKVMAKQYQDEVGPWTAYLGILKQ